MNQIGGKCGQLCRSDVSVALFKCNIATFDPAQLPKRLLEYIKTLPRFAIAFRKRHQHADMPHPVRLLRACRERPPDRCGAERGYELPPSNALCHLPRARCCRHRISRLKMAVCGRQARRLLGVLPSRLARRGAAVDDPKRSGPSAATLVADSATATICLGRTRGAPDRKLELAGLSFLERETDFGGTL